jgi:gephyrin
MRDKSSTVNVTYFANMSTTNSKLKAAILIVSETASQDPSTDKCIPILKDVFGNLGNDQWDVVETEIVPDSVLAIQKTIRKWTDGAEPINLIISSGGTGFATKDVTPEVCHLTQNAETCS